MFLLGAMALVLSGAAASAAVETDSVGVPLYTNLGTHGYTVTTSAPEAQAYFDQGLRLYYAFNHQEAIRSFREAQRLDPTCAMCWWGEALAWGPNINMPMDSGAEASAVEALAGALARRRHVSERERLLMDALVRRYGAGAGGDRAAEDSAYARAMGDLAQRSPEDEEIAVLYAESLMDLRPWDYWTETGELQPGMREALDHLERVLARNADHPGANHFYIHLVEQEHPEWAVPMAERLAGLMPGAGHLVHMPGHIYIRVGRYEDAIRANEHAVHADETYIQDQRPGMGVYTAGYYPHNYDFLAFAAMMAGRSEQALRAAERIATVVPEAILGAPDMTFAQHYVTRSLQLLVRFGRWDELLAAPPPPADLAHAQAMWHYAHGRALAATGDVAGAAEDLAEVRSLARRLEGVRLEPNQASDVLAVAAEVLAGHIAAERGETERAIAALREAARLEDALLYGEPPEWTVPVRQELGALLLAAGRPAEAERAFREDLERFPENGWSLHGLAKALREQGRSAEAEAVETRFLAAWAGADTEPGAAAVPGRTSR